MRNATKKTQKNVSSVAQKGKSSWIFKKQQQPTQNQREKNTRINESQPFHLKHQTVYTIKWVDYSFLEN